MSTPATAHAAAAAEHTDEANRDLHHAIDLLGQVLSYLRGSREDHLDQAAGHLFEIAEHVGSSTANQIGVALVDVKRRIEETDSAGIAQAVSHLEGIIGELAAQADRTRQLAQQLGA